MFPTTTRYFKHQEERPNDTKASEESNPTTKKITGDGRGTSLQQLASKQRMGANDVKATPNAPPRPYMGSPQPFLIKMENAQFHNSTPPITGASLAEPAKPAKNAGSPTMTPSKRPYTPVYDGATTGGGEGPVAKRRILATSTTKPEIQINAPQPKASPKAYPNSTAKEQTGPVRKQNKTLSSVTSISALISALTSNDSNEKIQSQSKVTSLVNNNPKLSAQSPCPNPAAGKKSTVATKTASVPESKPSLKTKSDDSKDSKEKISTQPIASQSKETPAKASTPKPVKEASSSSSAKDTSSNTDDESPPALRFKPLPEELKAATTRRATEALHTWYLRLHQLYTYKLQTGNTNIPQKYEPNPPLGVWVNKQRNHRKELTTLKIDALDAIGFDWGIRRGLETWSLRYADLQAFNEVYGTCNVPTKFPEHTALGRWVSTQRHEYKARLDGKATSMTDEKVRMLEELGFVWSRATPKSPRDENEGEEAHGKPDKQGNEVKGNPDKPEIEAQGKPEIPKMEAQGKPEIPKMEAQRKPDKPGSEAQGMTDKPGSEAQGKPDKLEIEMQGKLDKSEAQGNPEKPDNPEQKVLQVAV